MANYEKFESTCVKRVMQYCRDGEKRLQTYEYPSVGMRDADTGEIVVPAEFSDIKEFGSSFIVGVIADSGETYDHGVYTPGKGIVARFVKWWAPIQFGGKSTIIATRNHSSKGGFIVINEDGDVSGETYDDIWTNGMGWDMLLAQHKVTVDVGGKTRKRSRFTMINTMLESITDADLISIGEFRTTPIGAVALVGISGPDVGAQAKRYAHLRHDGVLFDNIFPPVYDTMSGSDKTESFFAKAQGSDDYGYVDRYGFLLNK